MSQEIVKKRIAFAVTGLVILLTGCATTTTQVGSSAFMPETEAMAEGKGAGGLERMTHEELLAKGGSYLRTGNFQLARLHYAIALKKNSQSAAAYAGLGETLSAEQNLKDSLQAFEQALAINPRHQQSLIAAGKIRRLQGKPLDAVDLFNRALTESPENPTILTEMAITYDSLGQEEKAEALYLKVVNLAPQETSSYNNLGFNYLLQRKYPEAARVLELALSRNQEDRLLLNNLATAYALNGQAEEALRLLTKSVGEAGAYNNLGYFYMIQEKWEKAEKAFKRALELNPVFYARARDNLEELKRIRNRR